MKILISGGDSKFSKELQKHNIDHTIIPLSKKEMNIMDPESIYDAIHKHSPDVFIHTAALSRPMSSHSEYPEKSININIIGTSNCVVACLKYNIKFVYISTDFVYPGVTGGYNEEDSLLPINKYAWSKLGGECACMLYDNSLILRMAMVEKPFPHKKAFTNSFKSSIWYPDAAKIVFKLIDLDLRGIYNIGGERKSIFNFASEEDFNILPENKDNILEKVPNDISMNINKLKNILNDTTI